MAGGWWLVASGWWLVARGWWLVAGRSLLISRTATRAGRWREGAKPQAAGRRLPGPTAYCLPPTASRLPRGPLVVRPRTASPPPRCLVGGRPRRWRRG
ncbi:MAG: hypothetical protein DCC67_10930 [Planctomycetota bacterium]|nr:MAG: hypothetical protein DCC67_10930 [Planctomycetota bacterium]